MFIFSSQSIAQIIHSFCLYECTIAALPHEHMSGVIITCHTLTLVFLLHALLSISIHDNRVVIWCGSCRVRQRMLKIYLDFADLVKDKKLSFLKIHCIFPILSIGKLWNVIKLPISRFQHSQGDRKCQKEKFTMTINKDSKNALYYCYYYFL